MNGPQFEAGAPPAPDRDCLQMILLEKIVKKWAQAPVMLAPGSLRNTQRQSIDVGRLAEMGGLHRFSIFSNTTNVQFRQLHESVDQDTIYGWALGLIKPE